MSRTEKTVFLSYRRTNMPWALAIYQNLTSNGFDVFFDYDSIRAGDFEQIIIGNIRARAHFLVVLTPSALERCVNPDDWLRREIETAIDEQRNIVPVFLEGFSFGSKSISNSLTGKLTSLKKYNGQSVPSGFFEEAMKRVRDNFLSMPLDAVLHPVSKTIQKEVEKQQASASEAEPVKQKELNAQEWFEKGLTLSDNSDEEIRCYTEAIRLKPDYADAYYNRGIARKDDLDSAIKDYTEAIRLKPDYADAYTNRGIARKNKDDLDGAIKDHTEAIRLKPDFAKAYNNRGNARNAKDDLDGAIKDYTEAIRLKPDYVLAYTNRGIVRQAKDDLDGAIKDYTEAIRLMPDYVLAYTNRGIVRQAKDDLDGAIKDYTEAIRLMPNDATTYYNRASIWNQKEDYYSAVADYEKCLELGDKDPNIPKFIKELKKKMK